MTAATTTETSSVERPPGSGTGPARTETSDRRYLLGIFFLIFGIAALFAGGHTYSPDGEAYLQGGQALLRLSYEVPITDANNAVTAVRPGRDGKMVTGAGLGQSFAAVPLLAVGRGVNHLVGDDGDDFVERLFAGFTNSWVHALVCVFLFLLCRELGARQRQALLLAVVYGVGTMALPHAATLFSESLTALGLTAAAVYVIRFMRTGQVRWAAIAGAFFTVALFGRVSVAPFAVLFALYVIAAGWRYRGMRPALTGTVAFGAVAAAGVVLVMGMNLWRFGSGTDAGYGEVPLVFPLRDGLHGLLFSPGKSVFLYAPIVAVAVVAFLPAVRRRPFELLLLSSIVVVNTVIFARFNAWHGGNAWGPRYMEITLPLMIAVLAPVISRGDLWRRASIVAGIVGVVVSFGGSALYFNNSYWSISGAVPVKQWPDGPNYAHAAAFEVRYSPILVHLSALRNVARTSVDRVDGVGRLGDTDISYGRFPDTVNDRYTWYITKAQLDTWWYLLFPLHRSKLLLLLLPVFLASVAVGARQISLATRTA